MWLFGSKDTIHIPHQPPPLHAEHPIEQQTPSASSTQYSDPAPNPQLPVTTPAQSSGEPVNDSRSSYSTSPTENENSMHPRSLHYILRQARQQQQQRRRRHGQEYANSRRRQRHQSFTLPFKLPSCIKIPQWLHLPWKRISLDDDGPLPLWMSYTIVLALSVSYFLAFLDQTILSTLTPRVANDQDELFQTTWVTASYLTSLSAFMLLYGKVAEIFGPLPVLIVALLIFLCGSALTAASTTMTWLILARAFAGMGAGGLISITQIMTAEIGPWHERGQYMGILGAVFGLSTTIGPLAGGLVADKWTWRYSFYVNVPLVCLTLIVLLLLVRVKAYPLPFKEKIARVDFFGALMLVTGLMLLLLGLNWGGRVYLWVSPVVIICISVGLLLLGVFFFVEVKLAIEPIIDPRLFRVRNVALIIPIEVCVGAVFFNAIFNLPAYYSVTQNSTASQSGVHMVPIACGVVVCSIVSGWLIARYNMYRLIAWVGTVSLTLGAGLLCLFDAHLSTVAQVPIMALLGSGIGCCIQTFLLTVQASVKPTDLAITTAFATFSQMSGGILGLAFGGVLSESTTKHHLLKLMKQFPAYAHVIREAKNDVNDLWSMDLPQYIRDGIISAYLTGLKHNFILFTCLGAITVVLSVFIDRVPPPKSSPGSLEHAQPVQDVGIDEMTVAGLHRRHHGYDEIQELQAIEARSRNATELNRREYEEALGLEW